jgi:hypothetical protein
MEASTAAPARGAGTRHVKKLAKRGALLLLTASVGVLGFSTLAGAQPPSTTTTIGQAAVTDTPCQAGSPGPYDAVQAGVAAGGPTYTAQRKSKITSWSTMAGKDGGVLEMEIWRPTTTADSYALVGMTPRGTLTPYALNTFTLKPPIQVAPGDLLGFRQESQYLDCGVITSSGNDVWATNHSGGPAPKKGSTENLANQATLQINIAATLTS